MDNRARVLLILPEDLLAEARVLAGKTMVKLKLPVSLQITLRALIEEGLKRQNEPALLATIEAHANTIRRTRKLARVRVAAGAPPRGAPLIPPRPRPRVRLQCRRPCPNVGLPAPRAGCS